MQKVASQKKTTVVSNIVSQCPKVETLSPSPVLYQWCIDISVHFELLASFCHEPKDLSADGSSQLSGNLSGKADVVHCYMVHEKCRTASDSPSLPEVFIRYLITEAGQPLEMCRIRFKNGRVIRLGMAIWEPSKLPQLLSWRSGLADSRTKQLHFSGVVGHATRFIEQLCQVGNQSLSDWLVVWTPLKNMNVNWDDYSQYMGK